MLNSSFIHLNSLLLLPDAEKMRPELATSSNSPAAQHGGLVWGNP